VPHPDGVLDMPEEVISHVGVDAKLYLQCPDSYNFLALILGLSGLEDAS